MEFKSLIDATKHATDWYTSGLSCRGYVGKRVTVHHYDVFDRDGELVNEFQVVEIHDGKQARFELKMEGF